MQHIKLRHYFDFENVLKILNNCQKRLNNTQNLLITEIIFKIYQISIKITLIFLQTKLIVRTAIEIYFGTISKKLILKNDVSVLKMNGTRIDFQILWVSLSFKNDKKKGNLFYATKSPIYIYFLTLCVLSP